MDCPLLECTDYVISLTRKKSRAKYLQMQIPLSRNRREGKRQRIYVFEGGNADKHGGRRAIAQSSRNYYCLTPTAGCARSGSAPGERLITEACGKINDRRCSLKNELESAVITFLQTGTVGRCASTVKPF